MKRICMTSLLLSLVLCVHVYGFGKEVDKQGYFNGKHWEIVTDWDKVGRTSEYRGMYVDGTSVFPCNNYVIDTVTIGETLCFKVRRTKDSHYKLYNIKGESVFSFSFDVIDKGGMDNLDGLYEFHTIDNGVHRQHLCDSKLNLIKSGYDGYARRINVEGYDGYFITVPSGTSGTRELYDSNLKLLKSGFSRASGEKLEGRNEIYLELTYEKGDSYEKELYTTDMKMVLPRYKYLLLSKDSQGNFQYWYIEDSYGYKGRLDSNWNWIIPLDKRFSEIYETTIAGVKYYRCKKGGYWGLFDTKFNEVIAPDFEELGVFDGTNFIKFKLNGFWGVMTLQGRVTRTIIPTTRGYTNISRYVKSQKRFTYEMYGWKGECDAITGRQVSKIKVETPVATPTPATPKKEVTKAEDSPKKQEGDGTKTIIIEHKHDPVPVQEWQACWACSGMGTMGCDNCGGSGTKYIGDRLRICSRCNGQRVIPCNVCFGNKGQYITVYR